MPPLPEEMQAITAEQVALGELLFFEPRIAADGKTTCAGCHDPDHDWAGGPALPTAHGEGNLRRALDLSDVAWRTNLAWDGRYKTVENLLYLHVRGQLGDDPSIAIKRIAGAPVYRAHFARAFGGDPDGGQMITALVAFTRTRYSPAAPWDSAEHGTAPTTDHGGTPEARGYLVFTGKAQCATCHVPPLYTDQDYHRLGLIKSGDDGRGKIDVDRKGAFKTPPLRGAALRPALFHDGSAATLEAAIDWHLAGGVGQGADKSIVELPAVTLTPAEREDLIAFVRALSAPVATPYPRPALPP
jgi:cytochrome c peroxidase